MSGKLNDVKSMVRIDDWVREYGHSAIERFYPTYLASMFDIPLLQVYHRLMKWVELEYLIREIELRCPECFERVATMPPDGDIVGLGELVECECGEEFYCTEESLFVAFRFNKEAYAERDVDSSIQKKDSAPVFRGRAGQGDTVRQMLSLAREAGAPLNVNLFLGPGVINNGHMLVNKLESDFDALVESIRGELDDPGMRALVDEYLAAEPTKRRSALQKLVTMCKQFCEVHDAASKLGRLVFQAYRLGSTLLDAYVSVVPAGSGVLV